jgi:septation ring formation regulator EzrA
MTNLVIQTDLAEILKDIKQSLNSIDRRLNHLEVGQAKIEEKLEAQERMLTEVKDTQKGLVKDVSDLKGAKSLIIPLIVAFATSLITLIIRAVPSP